MFLGTLLFASLVLGGFSQNAPPREPRIIQQGQKSAFYIDFGTSYENLATKLYENFKSIPYRRIGVLVDESTRDVAKKCLEILAKKRITNDFVLMIFNSTGYTSELASFSDNQMHFYDQITGKNAIGNEISSEINAGNELFFAILQSVRSLPRNTAILVFISEKITDTFSQHAARELEINFNRLYVVWKNTPKLQGEEAILKEVAENSNGGFYLIHTNDTSYDTDDHADVIINSPGVLVLYRTQLHGSNSFKLPIDLGTKSIQFSISSGVTEATIELPHGNTIDLLSKRSVSAFSRGSFQDKIDKTYVVHLNIPREDTGTWNLNIGDDNARGYNVSVLVYADLQISISRHSQRADFHRKSDHIRLGINGLVQSVDNITIEDTQGHSLNIPLKYTLNDPKSEVEDINDSKKKEIDINLGRLPQDPFLIKVKGRDNVGNEFVRLTYYNSREVNVLPPISVDVGAGSTLLLAPGQQGNIIFEVTNNLNEFAFVRFLCRDQRYFLVSMLPHYTYLSPRQKLSVNVAIYAVPGAGPGDDLITFEVLGSTHAKKALYVKANSQRPKDDYSPHMWHKYTSDCTNNLLGKCEDASWSIEVTAQDKESGLLQVTTGEYPLNFPVSFISGTTEEVTGYLSGSCCNPTIQLTAIDLSNNRRVYVADAYKTTLSPGAIAAIVLSILFIIAIIILIVWCVIKNKKEKGSMTVLHSYNGPSGRY